MKHTLILVFAFAIIVFSCKLDELEKINPCMINPPVAAFSPDKTSGTAPSEITISNNSTPTGLNFKWNFGDGRTSTQANPTAVRYDSTGNFTITLIVSNSAGCADTASTTISITQGGVMPVAGFTADLSNNGGFAPCVVKFMNTSINAVQFLWVFGDQKPNETGTSPTHIYEQPGEYLVKLIATSSGGLKDTLIKPVTINVRKYIKTYGSIDSRFYDVISANGTDFLTVGSNFPDGSIFRNVFIMGFDINGTEFITKNFSLGGNDEGFSICKDWSSTSSYFVTGRVENPDQRRGVCVLKISSSGDTIWTKIFGETDRNEWGSSVFPTNGGGCVVSCWSYNSSFFDDAEPYVVKLSPSSNVQFQSRFSDGGLIGLRSIIQSNDVQSYFAVGHILPIGSNSFQSSDIYFLKLNSSGVKLDSKSFGGSGSDIANYIMQTQDNSILVFGSSNSPGGNGGTDVYILKLDTEGNIYPGFPVYRGTTANEGILQVKETNDGGYILVGTTDANTAGGSDVLLMKLRPDFSLEWMEKYGTSLNDYGSGVVQTSDNGYIIVGTYNGKACVIKTDENGKVQ